MNAGARSRVVVLLAAAWFAHASAQLPADLPADRWNLSENYPSLAAWNADAQKLDAQVKELSGCKGPLGESVARFRKCLDLLRAGASGYPYDLVKAAGVDLATTAPYRALFARMNGIMDEIEAILARRK